MNIVRDIDTLWQAVELAGDEVRSFGEACSLPFTAAQSDIGNPEPMLDAKGLPYVLERFRWLSRSPEYWNNRRLALDHPLLRAARLTAEPFVFDGKGLVSWRSIPEIEAIDCSDVFTVYGVASAIVSPVHMPGSRVGAVVWASDKIVELGAAFEMRAGEMHMAALKFLAIHSEASSHNGIGLDASYLTRREVQCARWASKGKTDIEIGLILNISMSTVRFHLRNAAAKFGVTGRTQLICHAAGLGFIGASGN